jgi:hypothetical protein
MSYLMIDGVLVAEIDKETASAIIRAAGGGVGRQCTPLEIRPHKSSLEEVSTTPPGSFVYQKSHSPATFSLQLHFENIETLANGPVLRGRVL